MINDKVWCFSTTTLCVQQDMFKASGNAMNAYTLLTVWLAAIASVNFKSSARLREIRLPEPHLLQGYADQARAS